MFTFRSIPQKLMLAAGLSFTLCHASHAAASFIDIADDYWAKRYIEALNERGVIAGYADQTFQPNKPVSRAEFAVILAKSQGLPNKSGLAKGQATGFTDLPATHWASPAILAIVKQGWMSGYPNHRFEPNRTITLAEMYAILAKAESSGTMPGASEANAILANYRDASELPEWARIPVAKAIQSGITVTEKSNSKLSPNQAAVRANVATSVAKLSNPAMRDAVSSETPVATQPGPATQTTRPKAVETLESCPAANIVGKLKRAENPHQWLLVRADGKTFPLRLPEPTTLSLRADQAVRVTGNLDAVTGSAEQPVLVVQTLTPVEAYQPAPAPVSKPAPEPEAQAQVATVEPAHEENAAQPVADSPVPDAPEASSAKVSANQMSLYFPNLANLVSDPALMLGEPTQRATESKISPHKAIEAILNGPTDKERRRGYFMDRDLKRLSLGKLTIDQAGSASVTLNAPGNFQFENTSVPTRLSEQIRRTLKQFDGIQSVTISVTDPKNKAIWISP